LLPIERAQSVSDVARFMVAGQPSCRLVRHSISFHLLAMRIILTRLFIEVDNTRK